MENILNSNQDFVSKRANVSEDVSIAESLKTEGDDYIYVNGTSASKFLSDLTVYSKYANIIPDEQRKQTWDECVTELMNMHIRRYPYLEEEIRENFKLVYAKKVMPSMRSIQFGGLPIEIGPNRIYNCAYANIDDKFVFAEIMFLLLGGTGVGFSVRKKHVSKLPAIVKPQGHRRFLIGDSIEGWSDSIRQLVYAYMTGKERPIFDYRDIRPQGSLIKKTGGIAPGPSKLIQCHKDIEAVLSGAIGRKLKTIEVHDIICYIANCILSGGIREAALISLFDKDDSEMMTCKGNFDVYDQNLIKEYRLDDDFGWEVSFKLKPTQGKFTETYRPNGTVYAKISLKYGDWDLEQFKLGVVPWYYIHPQRARANNSVALRRGQFTKKDFMSIWNATKESMAGEPGIYQTNDDDMGTNPCVEIALNHAQFCNLSTIIVYDVVSQEELNKRAAAAAFIGTLQAGYTDFHYLRPIWKETTEREALIGVSMTGIASGSILNLDLVESANVVKSENMRVAAILGINSAARTTCIKPEGSGTLAAGVIGSGIHAAHGRFFIRNNRIKKDTNLYSYLSSLMPEFIETDLQNEDKAVVSIPLKASPGVITRDESAIEFLERIKKFSQEWVLSGHNVGVNTHNVSATVSVRDNEWDEVAEWMWNNRSAYAGLSVLPYFGGSYRQAPFIEITEDQYNELIDKFPKNFDFTQIKETIGVNHATDSLACSGAGCEV